MKKYLSLAFLVAGVSLLAACGDDDSSSAEENKTSSGPASVESLDDLVHCTKSHYGEIVFVEEEGAYFECTSEDWVEVDSAKVDSILATSSSSADTDTVKSSSSVKADSSEIAEVETKKVDSVTVSGFAQKGPYASGSVVTVYGLDSLLEKTKTKFSGKVSGDSGAYSVSKIVLPSQFALVEVNGFYTSENTGKKTSGSKTTLNAVVDLSAGKSVKANVNILTELEYARVKYLVANEKFNVPAAKKRATKELLAVFGGKGGDDLTATTLSLADTGSAGTALLAASILLQGDLSASKFGSRLGDVADLFAEKGSFDSDSLRADLADWASKADSVDNFAAIRKNVKDMKLAAAVPDFEKILYAFWTAEYNLGACSDSLEETIKKNENKLSENYGAGYVCTSKRWHKSSAIDTDLGLCTGKMEGSFKEYKGGKSTEYYVCRAGTWNKITETQYELKECTESCENEYVKAKSGDYFVCSGKQWLEIDAVTYELKLCTEKRNKELGATEKSGSYVCEWDGKDGSWRKASDIEVEFGVCGGGNVTPDSIYKTEGGEYYSCKSGSWGTSTRLEYEIQFAGPCTKEDRLKTYSTESYGVYVCENETWRKADSLENIIGVCGSKENPANTFKQDKSSYYVCVDSSWTPTDSLSFAFKTICSLPAQNVRKKLDDDNYYVCQQKDEEWTWEKIDRPSYELGLCGTDIKDSLGELTDKSCYACDGNKWEKMSSITCKVGTRCAKEIDSTFVKGYACIHEGSGSSATYYWREQTPGEKANNAFCTKRNRDSVNVQNGFVCGNQWREATEAEKATGLVCNLATIHQNMFYQVMANYVCDGSTYAGYRWRDATPGEIANGVVCNSYIKNTIANGYTCYASTTALTSEGKWSDLWVWYESWPGEIANNEVCDSLRWATLKGKVQNGYICIQGKKNDGYGNMKSTYNWRTADASEIAAGRMCDGNVLNDVMNGYACECISERSNSCNTYAWRKATLYEKAAGRLCGTRTNREFVQINGEDWRCTDTLHHVWEAWTYETITDTRESTTRTYRIVDIGDSMVMVDNLRFQNKGDGKNTWWWCLDSLNSNCEKYGVLYRWSGVMDIDSKYNTQYYSGSNKRGICPQGWHVPNGSLPLQSLGGLKPDSSLGYFDKDLNRFVKNQNVYWWGRENFNQQEDSKYYAYASSYNPETGNSYYSRRKKINGYYLKCVKD